MKVTVVDYGLGNLFSIQRALTHLGADVEVTSDPERVGKADALILPGVGAFGDGMDQLRKRRLVEPILQAVGRGRPLLGICLGMQLFFTRSEEFGRHEGLGIIEGTVLKIQETDAAGRRIKVPHVGWSPLHPAPAGWSSTVLEGLSDGDSMYFVHSFVPFPEKGSVTVAQIEYGGHAYCALVEKGSVVGSQFHPEKSGQAGLQLLQNFLGRVASTC